MERPGFNIIPIVLMLTVGFGMLQAADRPEKSSVLSPAQIIAQLNWLEGEWGNKSFNAFYTNPTGGMILSVSKEFEDGNLVFYEFETIIASDSMVALTPFPFGNKSVHFTLVDYNPDSTKAVFENKTHDFPTRISYDLVNPDNLLIIVSGIENDKPIQFRYDLIKK